MESIKDKVAIVGMGCVKFGENWEKSVEDMIVEAAYEAYEDAGIEPKDIQAAWFGTVFSGLTSLSLTIPLKLGYIPVTKVENMCASGSEAMRAAAYAIASGACDIALAVGAEKIKDMGTAAMGGALGASQISSAGIEYSAPAPTLFAPLAVRYAHHYGLSIEELKRYMAQVSVKNHYNGSLSPKAHFQMEVTVEQVLNAPIICWPLGLFDCCGFSDGAAAAILTRADLAKKFRQDPVYIKSMQVCVGRRDGWFRNDYDYVHFEENVIAAKKAYDEVGIANPLKELSLAIVHDCFSITEMVIYEDMGWCPRGKAKEYIDNGAFTLKGELPVNTDGGLKCFGHPFGASGLRMMYEAYKQLQGKAGPRQVKAAELAMTHNLGGGPGQGIASIFIVGR